MKLNIGTKLILATMLMLGVTILVLSYRYTLFFEDIFQTKEEQNNFSSAVSTATQTENILQSLLEKSKSIGGLFILSQGKHDSELSSAAETILQNDKDIISIDVYIKGEGSFTLQKAFFKKSPLPGLSLDELTLEQLRKKSPFPISNVSQGQIEIQTVLLNDNFPLMALGMPIQRNELGQVKALIVTYFQLSKLQKAFAKNDSRLHFLIDSRGRIIAHTKEENVTQATSFAEHPLVQQALANSEPRGQASYQHPFEKSEYRGAYVKTPLGPIVITEVSQDLISEPSRQARRTSIFVAGIVLAVSVVIIFIFSLQFSSPIEKLATLVRRIAEGDLDFSAQENVRSQDEVGELAKTFDDMLVGLRERAKAFAVMRQALGRTVIDTLMNMKEEEMGGQRKPVAVLFSDLRDFTKFSEGHSPEEVVQMLNEYFDVMVKVIEKHHGWLDKFIGDAIMAVWGVPYTNEGDIQRATLAALDMRIALNQLNEERIAKGLGPIKIGIGLHCGDAIVGKIGATERANLTVIGDTVNQASRIEASTKAFGTDILLSQEMVDKLGTRFWTVSAGAAEVKGKSEALKLYKLSGMIDEDGTQREIRTPYSEYKAEGADKVKIAS